jgi:hypothetical protein
MNPFALWLRLFLPFLPRGVPVAQLSPPSQAKLDQAFADKAAADQADAEHKAAADALTLASQAETQTADAARTAHATATQSAHDFIAAAAAELGFPLPGS